MNLWARWRRVPEWGKAFVIALGLLGFMHAFVLRWATVQSTSMYATLIPGDLLGVERWPVWTGLHRGDILVFHDPVQDDRPMRQRRLLVKRIVAMPGDEVEIRQGELFVNGLAFSVGQGQTARWTVRMKEGAQPAHVLGQLDLPADFVLPGHSVFDLPLNEGLADRLKELPDIITVIPGPKRQKGSGRLFPHGPNYQWSNANYGPLRVPKAKDTVIVDARTLPVYDRIISRYEHNRISVSEGAIQINDQTTDRYTIQGDYYFVLGDSRDHSEDSRYWGFVPADHAVGRAGFVLLNARAGKGRTFKGL